MKAPFALALALALVATLELIAPSAASAATANVGPGQSIQAAIDAASPGDTIVVAPGTYRENLKINKDNITLQGTPGGTTLAPPGAAKVTHNPCFVSASNFDGICLPSVSGVTVSGFTVRGFLGVGIHAINSDHLTIDNNRLNNNGLDGIADYGGSVDTISHNQAAGSSEAGILVADSPAAAVTVSDNTATNNGVGIYVRDVYAYVFLPDTILVSNVIHNQAENNCVGILVLDTPAPPQNFGINVYGNTAIANNKTCPPTQYLPATTSGTGIAIIGANATSVRGNILRNNVPSDIHLPYAGGLVIASYPGGPVITDFAAAYNTAFGNKPFDIDYQRGGKARAFTINSLPRGIGSGVIFVFNNCDTSHPQTIILLTSEGEGLGPLCRPTPVSQDPGFPGF
ncbi:MAG TPA: right-handed parallel beta-helix repeat-containing protein [Acidimicrobiales bacterium]|nr:right-handed parallel beta-helix repeat-containing protein [Acidimicrobiales bacterium]